jgi:hypothetical protein
MTALDITAQKRIGVELAARPSITYWVRGEPDPRSDATDALVEPLRARVRDPLWFLTRQWQVGEFLGADSGSPAYVALTERVGQLRSWAAAGQPTTPLGNAPIESQCEPEPFTPDVAIRVELGQIFEQLLTEQGQAALIDAFRTEYPISEVTDDPSDLAETRFRLVVGTRAIDGIALLVAANAAAPALPPAPVVLAAGQAAVLAAVNAFRQWVADTLGATGTADPVAWRPSRLEYALEITGTAPDGTAVVLAAAPGADGLVDWSALDLEPASASSATPRVPEGPHAETRAIIPTHVRFRGAPNARFWDFELAEADLGSIVPDKRDLARLALLDFMLVHANDWFTVPVDLAPGALHQVDQLLVQDVFGVATLVRRADREPISAGRWSLFTTSVADQPPAATADFFILSPSAGSAIQVGTTLEDVRFARDEVANMVWALEQMTENGIGGAWSGHERDVARNVPPPGTAKPLPPALPGVDLRYAIESRVPEHWIPFLPVSIDPAAGSVALERAAMLRDDGTPIEPAGRILRPSSIGAGDPYQVPEEQVARSGAGVQRVVCRCRWVDGSTHLWVMRQSGSSAGAVNSALRFDQALPVP